MSWQLAAIFLVHFVVSVECEDTDDSCHADLGLIQKSIQMQAQGSSTMSSLATRMAGEPNAKMAVAFAGNGALAVSVHAGMTSALLGMLRRVKKSATFADLFSRFGIVASSNAGSRHVSMMTYSDSFSKLLHQMAEKPQQAGDMFTKAYTWAVRNEYENFREGKHPYALSIRYMMKDVAGIDHHLQAGDYEKIQPFMRGKLWLVATSLPVGKDEHRVAKNKTTSYYLSGWNATTNLTYMLPFKALPGVFALRMNESVLSLPAARPFSPIDLRMNHIGGCQEASYREMFVRPNEDFKFPGHMSVVSLAAASPIYREELLGPYGNGKESEWDLMWALPDDALNQGYLTDPVNRSSDYLCSVYAVSDSAYTDNTGIATAIAGGADTVTAFFNGYNFKNFLRKLGMKDCAYAIFDKCPCKAMYDDTEKTTIYSPEATWAKIVFSSVNMITKANQWFGITAERVVTLNIMVAKTAYDYSFDTYAKDPSSFQMFGKIAQTVVSTLLDANNMDEVCVVTKKFFDTGVDCKSLEVYMDEKASHISKAYILYNRAMDPVKSMTHSLQEQIIQYYSPVVDC